MPDSDDVLYSIEEGQKRLKMGRGTIYEEIDAGRLRTIRRGRRRFLTPSIIRDYIALLARETEERLKVAA